MTSSDLDEAIRIAESMERETALSAGGKKAVRVREKGRSDEEAQA